MPQLLPGTKITAQQFNELVDLYDSYWRGNNYSFDSEHTTDYDRRKGWGQIPVVPSVNTSTEIESLHFNQLGAQVNAGLYHIDDTNSLIPKRKPNVDYPTQKDLILNSHYNEIYSNITVNIDNNKFSSSFQTPNIGLEISNGGSSWVTALHCEFKYSFTSYDQARYFFNSGGLLTLDLNAIGGEGYWLPIFNSFGQIQIGAIYTDVTGGNSGIQFGGFYSMPHTGEEKLIILLQGSTNGEYGSYGAYSAYSAYGGAMYSNRNVRVFIRGEESINGFDVSIRIQLSEDESDLNVVTSEIIVEAGSETPDNIPSQAAFIVDGQQYLFVAREEPIITLTSNWNGS